MRKNILSMALYAGASSAHIGGALSSVEIIATLYEGVLNHKPTNPLWEERDRFILSKGHGCLSLYSVLVEKKYIKRKEMKTFEKPRSQLLGHPIINKSKGIEFSTGSLGMGLSLGIGVAISAQKKNKNFRVYVLMGDGECNEGSVWEAAMLAPHLKMNNLVGIIDRNKYQQTGYYKEILNTDKLSSKWKSFGWDTRIINGHNTKDLYHALSVKNNKKPVMIIANTIKGKGISFAEQNNSWHHSILSKNLYEKAIKELK